MPALTALRHPCVRMADTWIALSSARLAPWAQLQAPPPAAHRPQAPGSSYAASNRLAVGSTVTLGGATLHVGHRQPIPERSA
jgi:hypothetical protein